MSQSNDRTEAAEAVEAARAARAAHAGEVCATAPPDMARTDPRRRRERRPYKIRGKETWALIRESYLAGASARQVAARYDVTEWAVWRRAWREKWTKKDRVEAAPPPALERLAPEAEAGAETADAGALSREALKGVGRALSQGRLDEARKLGQLAASLGRVDAQSGAGAGRGDFTLNDMVRIVFDLDYRTEVMRVDHDQERDEDKDLYWRLNLEAYEADGRRQVALKTQGWREGRAELRAEMGLAPVEEAPEEAVYRFYGDRVYRRKARQAG